MEYCTLNNGQKMPMIGFGTWDVHKEDTILQAIEVGYRLFDTAQMYGNESVVGKAIKKSGMDRNEFFITTKLSHDIQTIDETLDCIQSSLNTLQMDYVDCLLVHEPYKHSIEMYKACEIALERGWTRSIGVSNFNSGFLKNVLENTDIVPVINQIESHVYYPQFSYKSEMNELGIQMQAWAPFTEGRRNIFSEPILLSIRQKYGKTSGQVALRYLVQNGILVIPKSSHKERMKENLDIFDFILDEDDLKKLNSLNINRSLFGWY